MKIRSKLNINYAIMCSKSLALIISLVAAITCFAEVNWSNNPVGALFARDCGEMPSGTFKMTNEGYEVFSIVCTSEDEFYQPVSLFYGKDNEDMAKVNALAPSGKVPSSMNCFLVRTPEGYIMFDTGLPASKGGLIAERLAALSVSQEDIKDIFITHCHSDHVGGLLDGGGVAMFPNARVHISMTELDFMNDKADAIKNAYLDRLNSFQVGELLPHGIIPIQAYGHTPGHTCFQLGNLLFVGDLMHGASIQILDPTICANYDMNRDDAITSRNRVLDYAVKNSLTVLGAHIPNNGVLF